MFAYPYPSCQFLLPLASVIWPADLLFICCLVHKQALSAVKGTPNISLFLLPLASVISELLSLCRSNQLLTAEAHVLLVLATCCIVVVSLPLDSMFLPLQSCIDTIILTRKPHEVGSRVRQGSSLCRQTRTTEDHYRPLSTALSAAKLTHRRTILAH